MMIAGHESLLLDAIDLGPAPDGEVTRLLTQLAAGDNTAEEPLVRLIYRELHQAATGRLRTYPADGTLTPTVLIHEAFVRVFRRNRGLPIRNRRHLFFAFAQAMWRIVVEHYRRSQRRRLLRVGMALARPSPESAENLCDLNEAIQLLRVRHPREFEIAMLRKTLGLSVEETAEVLEVSPATVKRGWALAKAFISRRLLQDDSS